MTSTTPRPTATIYEFPSGRRASSPSPATPAPALPAPPPIVKAEYGSAWYHEAAVQEALNTRALPRPVRLVTERS